MVQYLLKHTISVLVTVAILVVLGILAMQKLPTSLLPEIPIPEISVQVQESGLSMEEMEQSVARILRQELGQVPRLKEIHSVSWDGRAEIRLTFEYGASMKLAFIDTNEKIDEAMERLPQLQKRPMATQTTATDMPVFTLLVSGKGPLGEKEFAELGEACSQMIRPRLEQLSEVAMADVTGLESRQLAIRIREDRTKMIGMSRMDIEDVLRRNNMEAGECTIQEQGLVYRVRMETGMRTEKDVEDLYLNFGGRVYQLKELADISLSSCDPHGLVMTPEGRGIALSLIKHPSAKMSDFRKRTHQTVEALQNEFPDYRFRVVGDQSELLDSTLRSLYQNLLVGLVLICLVSMLFFRDMRFPLIVSLTLVLSLVISMIALYAFHISLNLVSLVGLILAMGMMIDNSLIVTEDIASHHLSGCTLDMACVRGTKEVALPMLSSMLTTVAVFIPLLFMDGFVGQIFHDQAIVVSMGLAVSYLIAVLVLPVMYRTLWYRKGIRYLSRQSMFERFYDVGSHWCFNHVKGTIWILVAILLAGGTAMVWIPKEKMPKTSRTETVADINWNDNCSLERNRLRTIDLQQKIKEQVEVSYALVGRQDFVLDDTRNQKEQESSLHCTLKNPQEMDSFEKRLRVLVLDMCPEAKVNIHPPLSVAEKLFPEDGEKMILKVYRHGIVDDSDRDFCASFTTRLSDEVGVSVEGPSEMSSQYVVADMHKLAHYGISLYSLQTKLDELCSDTRVIMLKDFSDYVPVMFSRTGEGTLAEMLDEATIESGGREFPLKYFVSIRNAQTFQTIQADKDGVYLPFRLSQAKRPKDVEKSIARYASADKERVYELTGAYFQNREMMAGLAGILLVSLLLIYLVMTAQFESFLQPFILLLEIPIDIAVGVLCLYLTGNSLNVMSVIGLIVSCGVVVNDSILKISMVNTLRANGMPLEDAIHEAGHKRIRAIVMTSLTSILVFVPMLWNHDMGTDMQRPFAVAMTGALTVGTLVSLFIIPMFYWLIYRKK